MNIGTKITWGYRLIFILTLLWLRFFEQYLHVWFVWVLWAVIIYVWFFQPFKKKTKPESKEILGS